VARISTVRPSRASKRPAIPRPLNVCSSVFRLSRRTLVFYASISSPGTSTAIVHMVNELTSAICGRRA
jgi:hypothetical protein